VCCVFVRDASLMSNSSVDVVFVCCVMVVGVGWTDSSSLCL
jgi:hypothetical protein